MRARWSHLLTMIIAAAVVYCAVRPRNAAEWWAQRPPTIHEARRAQGRSCPWVEVDDDRTVRRRTCPFTSPGRGRDHQAQQDGPGDRRTRW